MLPLVSFVTLPNLAKPKKESWLDKEIKDMTKGSVAREMAVGGISGLCSGLVFSKVGKTAASALAGGLLLFQIAQHQGYINVNWKKVNKDIVKAKGKLEKHSNQDISRIAEETRSFIKEYKFLVLSFAGGFLLGVAIC